jgi:LPXTG-motif cell wall-anchored protein
MNRYDVGAVEVTLAEFTADGGIYTPSAARLAETGSDFYGYFIAGGIVCVAAGLVVLYRRDQKSTF